MDEIEHARCYVYAYIRNKTSKTGKIGTPYYIGKGTGNRCYNGHTVHVPRDRKYIVFLESNLTDLGALAIERRLIAWWGRKDLGTGILCNRTDGGDGVTGKKMSQATKDKISKTTKGRPGKKGYQHTNENKAHLSKLFKGREGTTNGYHHTADAKRRISEYHTGRPKKPLSEETKEKLRAYQIGKPKPPKSEETKARMRIAATKREEAKRLKRQLLITQFENLDLPLP